MKTFNYLLLIIGLHTVKCKDSSLIEWLDKYFQVLLFNTVDMPN